jgi:hypothetical protein
VRFSLITMTVALLIGSSFAVAFACSECLQGGVVDVSAHIGYFAQLDHSVVAIDLRNGTTVWTSPNAGVPLALSEGGLLVTSDDTLWKTGQFTVAILDVKTGQLRVRSKPINIGLSPVTSDERPPTLTAYFEKEVLVVQWETDSRYRGGAAPPTQRANIPPKKLVHSVVFNPTTGEPTETTSEPAQSTTPGVLLPASVSYRRRGEWVRGPWLSGKTMANIESSTGENEKKIELRIWDKGALKSRAMIELTRNEGDVAPYVTADGNFVILPSTSQSNNEWRIFSVEKASEIAHVQLASHPLDLCVVDSRLLYLSSVPSNPKSATVVLRSVDLRSGQQQWERTLGQRQAGNVPKLPQ